LSRAFTLLEVMVAVAILGLSLTVILSAQAGLYASGTYAQHISVATGLARCRMSELEERLLKYGYPEIDDKDEGACCDGDTQQEMRCEWKVEKVELPQPQTNTLSSSDGGGLSAVIGAASSAFAGQPAAPSTAPTGTGTSTMGGMGPLGALAALSGNPQTLGGSDGGFSTLASTLSASTGSSSGGGATNAIAPLVMGFVYPQLKPMLEASIRKVTVKVVWHEGLRSRDVEIVQYVTNPVRGNLLPGTGGDGGVGFPGLLGGGSPGGSGLPGGGLPGGGLPGGAAGAGISPPIGPR
jgi:general secretion pathway protein I